MSVQFSHGHIRKIIPIVKHNFNLLCFGLNYFDICFTCYSNTWGMCNDFRVAAK